MDRVYESLPECPAWKGGVLYFVLSEACLKRSAKMSAAGRTKTRGQLASPFASAAPSPHPNDTARRSPRAAQSCANIWALLNLVTRLRSGQ